MSQAPPESLRSGWMTPLPRSLVAIASGYALFTAAAASFSAISGHDPRTPADSSFPILSTGAGVLFALAAGYLAAWAARRRPFLHAAILAALLAIEAFASIVARPAGSAISSQLATILLMAPSAALGGWIRAVRGPASRAVADS